MLMVAERKFRYTLICFFLLGAANLQTLNRLKMKNRTFRTFLHVFHTVLTAISFNIAAQGQQGWFRSYPTSQTGNTGAIRTALDVPNGNFIWTGWEYPGGITIGRTDAEGGLLWDTVIPFGPSVITRDLAVNPEGNITILCDHQYAPNKWASHLLQTDANGNVLWDKINFPDTLNWTTDMVRLPDGGYLVSGSKADTAVVVFTDETGQTIWTFKYKEPDAVITRGRFIDINGEGKVLLSIYVNSALSGYSRLLIRQTDSAGSVFWQKEFNPGPDGYQIDGAAYTPGGEVLISGAYQDSFFVQKMTSDGDSLWRVNLAPIQYVLHVSQFTSTQDGGGVIAAMQDIVDDKIFIAKCSAAGTVEWRRIIHPPDSLHWPMTIYSINQTSDGGYVLAGAILIGGFDKPLLIRLDSGGNLVSSTIAPGSSRVKTISVFPNPVSNGSTLQIPAVANGVFELFGCTGTCIFQNDIIGGKVVLENTDLPAGIYLFRVRDQNKIAGVGRLIIN